MTTARKPDGDGKETLSRREFLGNAGLGGLLLTAAACAYGLGRSALPVVTSDPAQAFKIGHPQDIPEGSRIQFETENVVVFRDRNGLYALSLECTHLGCICAFIPDVGFECPCHGSAFALDGKVTRGPAPAPLKCLELSILPTGQVEVNKDRPVPPGTRLVA